MAARRARAMAVGRSGMSAGIGVGVGVALILHGPPSMAAAGRDPLLASPFDTGLGGASAVPDERLVVKGQGRRRAPLPGYEDGPAPWQAARAIRDPRTGADTTAFGNAFNLGDPMGSDERSSETGGTLVAPRHP